jgi:acetyl esterase/lipase
MRKSTITTIATATLASALLALPAFAGEIEIIPDVVYGHKMGMALTFDVAKPDKPNGAGILFMVSGGWVSRWSPPDGMTERFQELLDAGFTVFAVRHGSSPLFKVPDAVEDVRRAARYIRSNAGQWGVDPERLGAFGGSAGGHLSLMLGLAPDEGDPNASDPVLRSGNRLAAVVAYFPPVDLTGWTGPSDRFPALDFAADAAASVSPLRFVSNDDPPTLLVHGDQDELVPLDHSQRIHQAFQKEGVATDLVVIEGAGHGFRGEHGERATAALVEWFSRHLAVSPSVTTAQ